MRPYPTVSPLTLTLTLTLIPGAEPFDQSVDLRKYGFSRNHSTQTIVINHVEPTDAGTYTCNNILEAS